VANGKCSNQLKRKPPMSTDSEYEMRVRLIMEREKQKSELREREADARHRRRMDLLSRIAMTIFMLGAGGLCFYIKLSIRFQQVEKASADAILGLILTGLGIFIGKNMNSDKKDSPKGE